MTHRDEARACLKRADHLFNSDQTVEGADEAGRNDVLVAGVHALLWIGDRLDALICVVEGADDA